VKQRVQGLAERRQELVARSSTQRAALAVSAEPLIRKTASLDRVVGYVRNNPVIAALAVGGVALLGPRRLWELGARAVTLYTLLRR
jgi:YqjK-like protein